METTMNASSPVTSRQLLAEIRARLQQAHFAARGLPLRKPAEAVADQLHAIRVLAEELEARFAA